MGWKDSFKMAVDEMPEQGIPLAFTAPIPSRPPDVSFSEDDAKKAGG